MNQNPGLSPIFRITKIDGENITCTFENPDGTSSSQDLLIRGQHQIENALDDGDLEELPPRHGSPMAKARDSVFSRNVH
ncbi:MAG TPA: hypothetical protein VFX17_01260 [Patescibacteria group bacterium]|nr:hypothetical protein [Patescibacteria group bacterium]